MDLQELASQLRKPTGENGSAVGSMMNNGNSLVNEWAIEKINLQAGDNVLEIGMGNGFFAKDILAKHSSIKYIGLDYSPLMVQEAKKINVDYIINKRAEFICSTADNLPFDNAVFSKIFTVNTIYFWGNARQQLAEIKRVLQPTGKLVVAIRSKEAMQQMPFTQFDFVKYDKTELVSLLEENGFNHIEVDQKKEPPYQFNGAVVQLENIIATCSP